MFLVAGGYCPNCQGEWTREYAERFHKVTGTVTLREALKISDGVRCSMCRKLITSDRLAGRSKKPFVRQDQIRLVNDQGKELFVYYGPTANIKKELSGKSTQLPAGFKGDGIALAEKLGMSAEDLAVHMSMSIEELASARFDVGKDALEKAEPDTA